MTAFNQQEVFYAAEEKSSRGHEILPTELQSYVDGLRDNPWVFACFPMVNRIEAFVLEGRGPSTGGWYEDLAAGKIEMRLEHLCERTVLHEVAHVLAGARYGSRAHDPWFVRTYLELCSLFAPHVYVTLYDALANSEVDFEADTGLGKAVAL